MRPVLRCKTTVPAGSHVGCHHCCLYGERSASAKRIHQDPAGIPGGQQDQRRCQILRNGSLRRKLPVTSLVQGFSGAVQSHRHFILHQKYTNGKRSSILREPGNIILTFQAVYHCLFHNRLDIRGAEQLGLHAGGLRHPELSVLRNILFPGKTLRPLKQLFKSLGMKTSHLDQNTFCCP